MKIILVFVILVATGLVAARLYLPAWLKDYVNAQIAALEGYSGSVADIDVALWRGAYQIHDMDIRKTQSNIPVPFVKIRTADLSVEWRALFQGAIVAEIDLYDADLNFAMAGNETQGTEDAGWARFVDALSPLEINRFTVQGGSIAFIDYSAGDRPVDLFVKDIDLRVENLRAIRAGDAPLPSPVHLTGTAIGGGTAAAEGAMNILKDVPDFDLDIKLENANLTAMNDFARSRAGVDFEGGDLSIYIEAAAKDGIVTGYVKPVARNVEMVDIEEDGDIISLAWQSVVSVFAEIFKNQPEDQLATRIEISGDLNDPESSTWSTIVNIFRNTFNAYIRDTDNYIDFSDTQPAAGD